MSADNNQPPLANPFRVALERRRERGTLQATPRVHNPSPSWHRLEPPRAVYVSASSQLFPTPSHLAARMVERALQHVAPTNQTRILEPSSGTGALLVPLRAAYPGAALTHFELNPDLAKLTGATHLDFLNIFPDHTARFDVVLMNPPFSKRQDVAHVRHALRFLAEDRPSILVAIIANAPGEAHDALRAHATTVEDLPADTFKASGTSARTQLLTFIRGRHHTA